MYSDELYSHFLESQNSQYSLSDFTKTLVVCGALLFSSSGSFSRPQSRVNLPLKKYGSNDYIISHIYSSSTPTWSDIGTTYFFQDDNNDLPETFNAFSKLTFLEGDPVAEKEADLFFSQVQVKTKKIRLRTRV